jgi:hypothetical protein
MRWALLLLLASGCQWARINHHRGSANSVALVCFQSNGETFAYDCFDYMETKVRVERLGSVRM